MRACVRTLSRCTHLRSFVPSLEVAEAGQITLCYAAMVGRQIEACAGVRAWVTRIRVHASVFKTMPSSERIFHFRKEFWCVLDQLLLLGSADAYHDLPVCSPTYAGYIYTDCGRTQTICAW